MQGFYKKEEEIDFLVWSADRVINDNFELWIDQKDTYDYPVGGWYWFDSEIEARNTLQCYGPKPFPSWVVDTTTASWQPPVPYPTDDKIYRWDETTTSWIESVE